MNTIGYTIKGYPPSSEELQSHYEQKHEVVLHLRITRWVQLNSIWVDYWLHYPDFCECLSLEFFKTIQNSSIELSLTELCSYGLSSTGLTYVAGDVVAKSPILFVFLKLFSPAQFSSGRIFFYKNRKIPFCRAQSDESRHTIFLVFWLILIFFIN